MATSSEDVLVMVPYVRQKKVEGSVYVMDTRIAWMPEGKETFTISHPYSEIKVQKVSPAEKARIQLQLVLQDGNTTTFLFSNPEGAEAQLKDREKVKDLLVQLLPKFKRKISKELEEKNKLLSENPVLLQLYTQLVIPQIITAEDFWNQYAPSLVKSSGTDEAQVVGVSSGFLAEIKPQSDGVNELRVNLNQDMIDAIYKTYPAVKRKHEQFVPKKMSESEFWTKFIHSHYFHRDRVHLGDPSEVFTECAKLDEQDFAKDISAGVKDPLADITRFRDLDFVVSDEGFADASHSQPLVRRFNQHSINVLKANTLSDTDHGLTNGVVPGNLEGVNGSRSSAPEPSPVPSKKARLQEATDLEDLEGGLPRDEALISQSKLKMSRVERYLHGPTVASQSAKVSVSEPKEAVQYLDRALTEWCLDDRGGKPVELIVPRLAVTVLGELSIGGGLMRGSDMDALASSVSEEIQAELRNLYRACSELLRHFWSSFPPTTPAAEEKTIHMYESLVNFQQRSLLPFEHKVQREIANGSIVTRHIQALLQSANAKYQSWQSRRTVGPPPR